MNLFIYLKMYLIVCLIKKVYKIIERFLELVYWYKISKNVFLIDFVFLIL